MAQVTYKVTNNEEMDVGRAGVLFKAGETTEVTTDEYSSYELTSCAHFTVERVEEEADQSTEPTSGEGADAPPETESGFSQESAEEIYRETGQGDEQETGNVASSEKLESGSEEQLDTAESTGSDQQLSQG